MGIGQTGPGKPRAYELPRPILATDAVEEFDCGKAPLNQFLKERALESEGRTARTYVVCASGGIDAGAVAGYYTLANGAVARKEMPSRIRHGLPNPTPVMVLGRLAVDLRHQGRGIGSGLLREALLRTLEASKIAGIRALVVHALDDEAITFYAGWGFQLFPVGSRTLFLPIETLVAALD
jgi:GNAT superfamily N-acetyltransferase